MTTMKNLLSNCGLAFAITFGKEKACREERLIGNLITFAICAVMMFTIVTSNYFVLPTLTYKYKLENCADAAYESYVTGNDSYYENAQDNYQDFAKSAEVPRVLYMLGESDTIFGEILQWSLGFIALFLFIAPIVVAFIAIYKAAIAGQELYLVNHRGGFFYNRELDKFYSEYRKKMYSSRELKRERLYKIFKNETCIVKLVSLKEDREATV